MFAALFYLKFSVKLG